MGIATIGIALWKCVMKQHDYFNSDHFVMSNGHPCLVRYSFLHLTGYKAMTLDQLKSYHSSRHESSAAGHPWIEHEGVGVTTGRLGQRSRHGDKEPRRDV